MLNKCMVIGRLGKDPEVRTTTSGKNVAHFSLATTEKYNDTEYTTWHNVEVWGKNADNCKRFLSKGKLAYVEGSLREDKWKDKEGKDRSTFKIVANNVRFLSPKDENNSDPLNWND